MIVHRHAIPYPHQGPYTLPIYLDAQIIHVGMKAGEPHLWEMHDEHAVRPRVVPSRRFRTVATGQPWTGSYRGTFIDGPYVFHIIETGDGRQR